MKNRGYNLLWLLFFIEIFSACNRQKNNETNIIHIENKNTKNIELSAISDTVFFVKLETDSNCLISKISQLELYGNLLFIRNDYNNLYVFNLNGKFITQIGSKGRGPKEYVQINSFSLDTVKKRVYIFDNSRILSFDFNGNFITLSDKIEQYYNSFLFKNYFYCYSPPEFSYYSKDSSLNMINVVSMSGKVINAFLPLNERYISMFLSSCNFYSFNDKLFFIESKNNTIYEVDSVKIKIRYKLRLGNDSISPINNRKIKFNSKYAFEFDNFLFIEYLLNNRWHLLYVNKQNNICVNVVSKGVTAGFYDDILEIQPFFPRFKYNNWLIDVVQPYDILKSQKQKNLINKDSDNPVIRIVVINEDNLCNEVNI